MPLFHWLSDQVNFRSPLPIRIPPLLKRVMKQRKFVSLIKKMLKHKQKKLFKSRQSINFTFFLLQFRLFSILLLAISKCFSFCFDDLEDLSIVHWSRTKKRSYFILTIFHGITFTSCHILLHSRFIFNPWSSQVKICSVTTFPWCINIEQT